MIGLDTETELTRPGLLAPPIVCLSWHVGGASRVAHWTEAEAVAEELLLSSAYFDGGVIVGCHIAFDMAVLLENFPSLAPAIFSAYDADRITDIQCREKLLDIARGSLGWTWDAGDEDWGDDDEVSAAPEHENYSLASLVKRHFHEHVEKENTWRLRYGELRPLPLTQWPSDAILYPQEDARLPVRVHEKQGACAEYLLDEFRQARGAFWLYLCSCWGLPVDSETVDLFEVAVRNDYERLGALLVESGLKRPDRALKNGPRKGLILPGARDTKAAARRMLEVVGAGAALTVPNKKTGKGGGHVKLDEAACIASGDASLAAYGEFASVSKILKTDVYLLRHGVSRPKKKADIPPPFTGRIHTRFESLVNNGRTATRPNIQNWATAVGMRECVAAPPGKVILAGDFSQNELHTLAQVCLQMFGHSRVAELINAGLDAHVEVAKQILGTTYEDAEARYKAGDADAYFARQCGKVANYGIPGGMGDARLIKSAALQYKVTIDESTAKALRGVYFDTFPEMREYFDYFRKLCAGDFATYEQLYSHRFRGGLTYCDACNTPFSGLAADLTKAAGWEVAKCCYLYVDSPLYGSRAINFPHDEIMLEVPEETAHECAIELERAMILGATPWIPDVPPVIDTVLTRQWSKKAKRIIDANGRLVPWDVSMIKRDPKHETPMQTAFIDALHRRD